MGAATKVTVSGQPVKGEVMEMVKEGQKSRLSPVILDTGRSKYAMNMPKMFSSKPKTTSPAPKTVTAEAQMKSVSPVDQKNTSKEKPEKKGLLGGLFKKSSKEKSATEGGEKSSSSGGSSLLKSLMGKKKK